MRRVRLIILLIAIAFVSFIWRKKQQVEYSTDDGSSAIDRIIGRTQSGGIDTGEASINVSETANGDAGYIGGGEYADYSEDGAKAALNELKRVIIVFEKKGDPTSEALHDDVTTRANRIPKNTIIFFANIEKETALAGRLEIENSNTITYLGSRGQEIRRSGNGIISLAQVVAGIDGLIH